MKKFRKFIDENISIHDSLFILLNGILLILILFNLFYLKLYILYDIYISIILTYILYCIIGLLYFYYSIKIYNKSIIDDSTFQVMRRFSDCAVNIKVIDDMYECDLGIDYDVIEIPVLFGTPHQYAFLFKNVFPFYINYNILFYYIYNIYFIKSSNKNKYLINYILITRKNKQTLSSEGLVNIKAVNFYGYPLVMIEL